MIRKSALARLAWGTYLVFFFLFELVLANALVAWEVATPRHYMRPGIIRVPLRCRTDLEVAILAILVTLTPGTLFLEVTADRSSAFVHGLHVRSPDDFRTRIRRLEDVLLKALR